MNYWFTRADAPISRTFVKRFDPFHWSVDFPRGTIASLVTSDDGHGLTVRCEFLRSGDLVGLIWESRGLLAHPAQGREDKRDYSGCQLGFHWQSSGIVALDQIDGPTLTIEGVDEDGLPRTWFVRLWNYASGSVIDADILIDFDALDGGFSLPADADRVNPKAIDRMFISLVAPGYVGGSQMLFEAPVEASVTITDLRCDGSGSVLDINDAVAPEHGFRIATAYDDMYNLPPEQIVRTVERLGYRGTINHYIGMSHYFALDGSGKLDPERLFNSAALAWHEEFARSAAAHGYELIWSISYEILDMFCPDEWKQRGYNGISAATGWDPPSALISPANGEALRFLEQVAEQCVALALDAGLQPRIQIGEPWWWVESDGSICLYDDAARTALGGNPVEIANVRSANLSEAQKDLLDDAGSLLAQSTAAIAAAVKAAFANAKTLLLVYLPTVFDPDAPDLRRANVPLDWAWPAFDVLQVEDYDWVTEQRKSLSEAAYQQIDARLGYDRADQHYLSGFILDPADREQWRPVIEAAVAARSRGCAEVFLWALPQVLRDGLTLFGKEAQMTPFDDVDFPIAIGAEASVAPGFSTNVVTTASGYESRNANWSQARLRFDAGPGVRSDAELEELIAFFRARRGPAVGFRFRDPYDFSSNGMSGTPGAVDQNIGIGDGLNASFALTKRYGEGEIRRITRPVAGSILIAIGGVEASSGWTLEDKGVVQFATAPAAGATISAGFVFDTPVRFAEDRIEINRATFLAGEAPSVPLTEVRED